MARSTASFKMPQLLLPKSPAPIQNMNSHLFSLFCSRWCDTACAVAGDCCAQTCVYNDNYPESCLYHDCVDPDIGTTVSNE